MQPRLSARVEFVAARGRSLFAGGVYSEAAAVSDLSSVFGTPTLRPESARHLSIGESVQVTPGLSATVTGFYKRMNDLTVRDPSPTPEARASPLLGEGQGRSYGVQVLSAATSLARPSSASSRGTVSPK